MGAKHLNPRIPTCHPDRKHSAFGLCRPCYDKQKAITHPMSAAAKERKAVLAKLWKQNNLERYTYLAAANYLGAL